MPPDETADATDDVDMVTVPATNGQEPPAATDDDLPPPYKEEEEAVKLQEEALQVEKADVNVSAVAASLAPQTALKAAEQRLYGFTAKGPSQRDAASTADDKQEQGQEKETKQEEEPVQGKDQEPDQEQSDPILPISADPVLAPTNDATDSVAVTEIEAETAVMDDEPPSVPILLGTSSWTRHLLFTTPELTSLYRTSR